MSNDAVNEDPVDDYRPLSRGTILPDITAGLVVFLVALPLCLGIALASGAPLISGLMAGIVGGIVIGSLSGSHTSVSGPAAGLTAVVAAQIATLGSFEAFLFAVFIGGIIQIALGIARAGALAAFFPSSVIKGLLAAIGVILILKQIPHVLGHDSDPEGDMSFSQPDDRNTFTELYDVIREVHAGDIQIGAVIVGLFSIVLLTVWTRWKPLKNFIVPGPLVVVLAGVAIQLLFRRWGGEWVIEQSHLVKMPVADSAQEFFALLTMADFSQWSNPAAYVAGATLAIVASLETLLNLQAVDKLDRRQRISPASRELLAQGVGNVMAGFVGALPMTSVIVRSSVNVNTGAKTKASAVLHGFLLLICVAMLPTYMNMIPLSSLAAILLVTGIKLASPKLFQDMWSEGRYQFGPFIVTLVSIVLTDLLTGILIGLGVSLIFILNSNLRRPIRRIVETRMDGDVIHVELSNQVSFLNRAALTKVFAEVPRGSRILLDASDTDYIDPDIQDLIREYKDKTAPARGVSMSLKGFRTKYNMPDDTLLTYHSTSELRDKLTPEHVLEILREGNRRFRTGNRLTRDLNRLVGATAGGQNPLATVLSCIDSRVPAELVFDLGIGDIFSVRVAGNVYGDQQLGSIEFGVGVAGVKLVVVMGHTRCGAVTSSLEILRNGQTALQASGCSHLQSIVDQIAPCVDSSEFRPMASMDDSGREAFVNEVARRNVQRTVDQITGRSATVRDAISNGQILLVGALYDVSSGNIDFLTDDHHGEDRAAS